MVDHRRWRAAEQDRAGLGFTGAVKDEFAFLLDFGFRVVEASDMLVRYESDRRFARVFHGWVSHRVGVGIGRWVDVDGARLEQVVPLRDLVALRRDPAGPEYGGMVATTVDRVRGFVWQLAGWTYEFAMPLLTGSDALFGRWAPQGGELATAQAFRLRARADQAWRDREFGAVVRAYRELEGGLPTGSLTASERARLDHALRILRILRGS